MAGVCDGNGEVILAVFHTVCDVKCRGGRWQVVQWEYVKATAEEATAEEEELGGAWQEYAMVMWTYWRSFTQCVMCDVKCRGWRWQVVHSGSM
jgi:hypothetical protein